MLDTLKGALVVLGVAVLALALAVRLGSRWLLRALLARQEWGHGTRKPTAASSRGATLWALCVALLLGSSRRTYDFESSLPALPVPRLASSVAKYLASVKPLLSAAELEALAADVQAMVRVDGFWLQMELKAHAANKRNWLSEWWLEYVFLRPRSPTVLNSNTYLVDGIKHSSAADSLLRCVAHLRILAHLHLTMWSVTQQKQTPFLLGSPVPLSMAGLRLVFGVTRIAAEGTDMIQIHAKARHVVVLRHGHFYVFDLVTVNGAIVSEEQLLSNIRYLWELPPSSDGPVGLAALTSDDRATWASNRDRFFSTGLNKLSLYAIESALFVLCLDEEALTTNAELSSSALHGNGTNRWFDKSFNYIVWRSGRVGLNCEHSTVDSPIMCHLFEALQMGEPDWIAPPEVRQRAALMPPVVKKLQWSSSPALLSAVESATLSCSKLISESDLHVLEFTAYGKTFLKKTLRIAVHGWIQMALQLAYYRHFQRFAMTYESCSTRLFAEGRSEGVRPLSVESVEWCKLMEDAKATPDEKVAALRSAVAVHSARKRDATLGQGCDRHLFGLLVISIKKQMKSAQALLTRMLSSFPFELSTAHVPTRLAAPHFPWQEQRSSIGGGFGAVTKSGLGVGFLLLNERFFFHVHSWRSSHTSSRAFGQLLERALLDMADVFAAVGPHK